MEIDLNPSPSVLSSIGGEEKNPEKEKFSTCDISPLSSCPERGIAGFGQPQTHRPLIFDPAHRLVVR